MKQELPSAPRDEAAINPFLSALGMRCEETSPGRALATLTLQEHHMNGWQVTHGGVVMAMLDAAMANAARSLSPDKQGVVTLEMKTNFLEAAGGVGATLEARSHAYHRSVTLCCCDAELWQNDRLVAKAMATFKYLRRARSAESLQKICS